MSRLQRSFALLAILAAGVVWPAMAQQAKDQAEVDLFNAILKETNAAQKLQLLEQWKQKYPDTAFKVQRATFYMQAYQQAGQMPKAVEAGLELLALEPANFSANFTVASLVPFIGSNDPKIWAEGEKAATALLRAEKPAGVTDADWVGAKKQAEIFAHQTLGWVAKVQKKNDAAERELLKTLELNSANATVSYWLGEVIRDQKNPEKNTLVFFCFARAAAYDGAGALAPAGRQQVDAYITKIYNNFHGPDAEGLAELKRLAKASHLPPADYKIKSKEEIAAEKEEELRKNNPLLATFMAIKDGLTGSEGAKFWEEMKGKAMPKMRGTIVSITPTAKPKTIGLAMSQSKEAEISLSPETTLPRTLATGATIEFEGAEAVEFTPNPFLIKMNGGKITSGLPEAPPASTKGTKKSAPAAPGKKTTK